MFAEYFTKLLVVFFGYAYPAIECFKTLEQPHDNYTVQLRFWCRYWIIVAILTFGEMLLGVIFHSFLQSQVYGICKMIVVVCLWSPKTKASDLIYETFVRPVLMQYVPNIEDLWPTLFKFLVLYLKHFTGGGYTVFLNILQSAVFRRSED